MELASGMLTRRNSRKQRQKPIRETYKFASFLQTSQFNCKLSLIQRRECLERPYLRRIRICRLGLCSPWLRRHSSVVEEPPLLFAGLKAWVDGFRFEGEDAEYAFVDAAQGFSANESFESFDSQGEFAKCQRTLGP